jgi:CheY-like chemotaxis protein
MIRVLVVDDDKSVGVAIRTVLETAGYEVAYAPDCMSGLASVQESECDVAMIDLFMPGIDGLETIKAFRQLMPDLPIVAISGFIPREGISQAPDFLGMATKLGATRSLAKPFRPRELIQAVRQCLEGGAQRSAQATVA